MAKLTVSFKGKLVRAHQFDSGVVTVGRDPDNTICIDSLAIAPKHLIIDLEHPDGPQLMREDERFPVEVNGHAIERQRLASGDVIHLGKHTLHYVAEKAGASGGDIQAKMPPKQVEASLQILNGKNIGRVIPLKRALTRLGSDGCIAVIARRQNGHFLSSLEGGDQIKVNGDPLGARTLLLNPGDRLTIAANFFIFHGG
ncbi:MAG: FHA domain-containing protein [Methylohalobius sp. ZOD2]